MTQGSSRVRYSRDERPIDSVRFSMREFFAVLASQNRLSRRLVSIIESNGKVQSLTVPFPQLHSVQSGQHVAMSNNQGGKPVVESDGVGLSFGWNKSRSSGNHRDGELEEHFEQVRRQEVILTMAARECSSLGSKCKSIMGEFLYHFTTASIPTFRDTSQ